jgi:hypothetical protein
MTRAELKHSLFFYRPRVGDVWEIRFPGKSKKVKTVKRVRLHYYHSSKRGKDVRLPTVEMDRQPKGRYFDVRVKTLMKWGRLIERNGFNPEIDESLQKCQIVGYRDILINGREAWELEHECGKVTKRSKKEGMPLSLKCKGKLTE